MITTYCYKHVKLAPRGSCSKRRVLMFALHLIGKQLLPPLLPASDWINTDVSRRCSCLRNNNLSRLQPVRLRNNDSEGDESLTCELKNRLFFKLCLEDGDFMPADVSNIKPPLLGLAKPLNSEPSHLMVSWRKTP